jgi:hypothetical protein
MNSFLQKLKLWIVNFLFNHIYPKCNNVIYYTSYDGDVCVPELLIYQPFGNCNIVYNYVNKWGIGKIKFDGNVTLIGAYTFANCANLKTICIPNSVTNIDLGAFNNCTISGFYGKFATHDNRSIIKNKSLQAVALNGIDTYTIPHNVDMLNSNFQNINRPDLTVVINHDCGNCNSFMNSRIKLYCNLSYVPEYAFKYNEFTKITLSPEVKSIDDKAFMRSEGTFDYETGERRVVDKQCDIICESTIPPCIGTNVFCSIAPGTDDDWEMDQFYYNRIFVPDGTISMYKRVWLTQAPYICETIN